MFSTKRNVIDSYSINFIFMLKENVLFCEGFEFLIRNLTISGRGFFFFENRLNVLKIQKEDRKMVKNFNPKRKRK